MNMTTEIQDRTQTEGPHRPEARILTAMLDSLPAHIEIRAIAINGQTGDIVVETYHEGLKQEYRFNNP